MSMSDLEIIMEALKNEQTFIDTSPGLSNINLHRIVQDIRKLSHERNLEDQKAHEKAYNEAMINEKEY